MPLRPRQIPFDRDWTDRQRHKSRCRAVDCRARTSAVYYVPIESGELVKVRLCPVHRRQADVRLKPNRPPSLPDALLAPVAHEPGQVE